MRLHDYGAREDSASRYGAVRRSSLSEPTVQSLVGDAVDGAPYRHALVWVPERLPTMGCTSESKRLSHNRSVPSPKRMIEPRRRATTAPVAAAHSYSGCLSSWHGS